MKTSIRCCMILAAVSLIAPGALWARGKNSMITGGARYHMLHSEFTDLPYDDGNLSYTLGYEHHRKNVYWQLMAGYCPEAGVSNEVDYVISPQFNILAKDRAWEGGIGIVGSFVEDENEENDDWVGPYGQLILGFSIPFFGMPLSIHAYYPFEDFGMIGDFDFSDIEYGAMLKFAF